MKVTLSISDDAELRAHIKDVIKGQVTSLMREEIRGVLTEVLTGKITSATMDPSTLITDEVRKMVKVALDSKYWGSPSYIQSVAREYVNKYLKEAFKTQDAI